VQATYVGHAWLVSENGNVLGAVVADRATRAP
jgi:hypothetical protein